jgi:CHAD domain-containing protein
MNRSLPLVRMLARRGRALRRHLAAAVAGKEAGVHQARVASRRLREALPVLTEGLSHTKGGKAQRKIRRITAALGEVRELDVTLLLIDELTERPHVPAAALSEVRAQVIEARERRRKTMLKRLASVDTSKLDRRLQAVNHAVMTAAPAWHGWRSALAVRVARRARRLARAIDDAGQVYAVQALHEVRIAAKKLRYALEIADESGAAPCADSVRAVKRVQDTLGRLHDLQVLQHHAAAVGATTRRRRTVPDVALAALSRLVEDECRLLHGRYVAAVPSLAAVVDTARRDVPARLTARRSARAVKMTLAARRRAAGGRA